MWKSIGKYTAIAIVTTIPFVIISANFGFISGAPPNVVTIFNSSIFILSWILVSLIMGYIKGLHFLIFIALYWSVLLGISFVVINNPDAPLILLPLFFMISPFYGSEYFLNLSIELLLSLYASLFIIICFLGFCLKKVRYNRSKA